MNIELKRDGILAALAKNHYGNLPDNTCTLIAEVVSSLFAIITGIAVLGSCAVGLVWCLIFDPARWVWKLSTGAVTVDATPPDVVFAALFWMIVSALLLFKAIYVWAESRLTAPVYPYPVVEPKPPGPIRKLYTAWKEKTCLRITWVWK